MTSRPDSLATMIGNDAFCPETGAPLSSERHYDEHGRAWRAVEPDERAPESADGRLTNGAVRSRTTALLTHFRRCHQRHHEPDAELYRSASLALARLKQAATGRQAWDVHVWYALERRLATGGHPTAWMGVHAAPRCPRCHGRLWYREVADDVVARCGSHPTDGFDPLAEIRDTVAGLYATAFPEDRSQPPDAFLRF